MSVVLRITCAIFVGACLYLGSCEAKGDDCAPRCESTHTGCINDCLQQGWGEECLKTCDALLAACKASCSGGAR